MKHLFSEARPHLEELRLSRLHQLFRRPPKKRTKMVRTRTWRAFRARPMNRATRAPPLKKVNCPTKSDLCVCLWNDSDFRSLVWPPKSANSNPFYAFCPLAEEGHPAPEPYSFSFSANNDDGSSSAREETGDKDGKVTGFYMLMTSEGQRRWVIFFASFEQNCFN